MLRITKNWNVCYTVDDLTQINVKDSFFFIPNEWIFSSSPARIFAVETFGDLLKQYYNHTKPPYTQENFDSFMQTQRNKIGEFLYYLNQKQIQQFTPQEVEIIRDSLGDLHRVNR
jgi:hypothetical protein